MPAEPAFRVTRAAAGTLAASGVLGFATAAAALTALEAAIATAASTRLDLAGVTACDSAGLACMLAVLATARARGCTLQLDHVPAAMHRLAQVSDVDALLG